MSENSNENIVDTENKEIVIDKKTELFYYKVKAFFDIEIRDGKTEDEALAKMTKKYEELGQKLDGPIFIKWWKKEEEKRLVPKKETPQIQHPINAVMEFEELRQKGVDIGVALETVKLNYKKENGYELDIQAFDKLLKKTEKQKGEIGQLPLI